MNTRRLFAWTTAIAVVLALVVVSVVLTTRNTASSQGNGLVEARQFHTGYQRIEKSDSWGECTSNNPPILVNTSDFSNGCVEVMGQAAKFVNDFPTTDSPVRTDLGSLHRYLSDFTSRSCDASTSAPTECQTDLSMVTFLLSSTDQKVTKILEAQQ